MEFINYIKDEALILMPALYIMGVFIKITKKVQDNYIPLILTGISVILSMALLGFNASSAIQGVLVAGGTVLTNQVIKQKKNKSN